MKIKILTLAVAAALTTSQAYAQMNVEFTGAIEVEANYVSTDKEDSSSDIIVPTAELGVAVQLNEWVNGTLVALYEENSNNDGELNIDTALISIANPNADWYVNAGQYTLPFGTYNSNMLSDPVTLEMGETADTALEFGFNWNEFNASVYTFQGDHSETINNFGVALNHKLAIETFELSTHLGFINNLAESDNIVDGGWFTQEDKVSAWIASAQINYADFLFIAEYLSSNKAFTDADNNQPSLFNAELGYNFAIADLPALFSVGYQGTDDADSDNWELPESRLLAALSVELFTGTTVGIEYKNEKSYTDISSDTVTAKLSYEF